MRRARGQSLVEFAILSPVLLLLVMGLLDLGRAYYFEVVSTDAARDAARYGSGYMPLKWPPVGYGYQGICDLAKSDMIDVISPKSVTCVYTTTMPAAGRPYYGSSYAPAAGEAIVVIACPSGTNGCNGVRGETVNANIAVTVYYHFDMVTPGMSNLFGSFLIFQNSAVFTSTW
jgi:hypothetical protein